MTHELVNVATEAEWRDYHWIRRTVLWDARGRVGYDEAHPDDRHASNHPILLRLDGRSIGTTRLDVVGEATGIVRLVAITPDMQRKGHGRILSVQTDAYACHLGLARLYVNAAPTAVGYYRAMGWTECLWDASELADSVAGCVQMMKSIQPQP